MSEAAFLGLFPTPDSVVADLRKTSFACVGDCDNRGSVTVDELVKGVNILLDKETPDKCTALDSIRDGKITTDELVQAVNAALTGCGS